MGNRNDLFRGMHTVPLADNINCSFSAYASPALVQTWSDREVTLSSKGTSFGFVYSGEAVLSTSTSSLVIRPGMYFSVHGEGSISGGAGFVCTQPEFRGLFTVGGPIEDLGRLRYIDGCSDTLLISPTLLGEPCFNFLYIPPGINQTAHTHPSLRIGMIVSGAGYCMADNKRLELLPGNLFILHPDEIHSFHTADESLRLVIFHPDSDFGPSHDHHPMINRTIVKGISANSIDEIRTKEISLQKPPAQDSIVQDTKGAFR